MLSNLIVCHIAGENNVTLDWLSTKSSSDHTYLLISLDITHLVLSCRFLMKNNGNLQLGNDGSLAAYILSNANFR